MTSLLLDLGVWLWPYFFPIALAPVYPFFLILSSSWLLPDWITVILSRTFMTFFSAVGIFFLIQGILTISSHIPILKKMQWPSFRKSYAFLLLWLILWIISTFPFFDDPYPRRRLLLMIAVITGLGASVWYMLQAVVTLAFAAATRWKVRSFQKTRIFARALLMATALYPFLFLATVLVWFIFDPAGSPAASRFAVVHAAIKNTCYIDPQKENCPQNQEEISYIEPKNYQDLIQDTQVIYHYDTKRQAFTLIIRYAPNRAVIFDDRLVVSDHMDLREVAVNPVTNQLKNSPDFLGPIRFPDWEYHWSPKNLWF